MKLEEHAPVEAKKKTKHIFDYNAQYSNACEPCKHKADIQKIDGNPRNYNGFSDSFMYVLKQTPILSKNELTSCFDKDMKMRWSELEGRYDDPDIVVHVYVQRAMNWP